MTYNLNALFSIPVSPEWQVVAALELGKYQSWESAAADRDEFSTGAVPVIVSEFVQVLANHYDRGVKVTYQLVAPPDSKRDLSIGG